MGNRKRRLSSPNAIGQSKKKQSKIANYLQERPIIETDHGNRFAVLEELQQHREDNGLNESFTSLFHGAESNTTKPDALLSDLISSQAILISKTLELLLDNSNKIGAKLEFLDKLNQTMEQFSMQLLSIGAHYPKQEQRSEWEITNLSPQGYYIDNKEKKVKRRHWDRGGLILGESELTIDTPVLATLTPYEWDVDPKPMEALYPSWTQSNSRKSWAHELLELSWTDSLQTAQQVRVPPPSSTSTTKCPRKPRPITEAIIEFGSSEASKMDKELPEVHEAFNKDKDLPLTQKQHPIFHHTMTLLWTQTQRTLAVCMGLAWEI
uniref:Uncharacterized protein n=1 Tax=Sphaerodactylus townsendi TaxID=933632 RepID=A0ACB8EX43_9SAUR